MSLIHMAGVLQHLDVWHVVDEGTGEPVVRSVPASGRGAGAVSSVDRARPESNMLMREEHNLKYRGALNCQLLSYRPKWGLSIYLQRHPLRGAGSSQSQKQDVSTEEGSQQLLLRLKQVVVFHEACT